MSDSRQPTKPIVRVSVGVKLLTGSLAIWATLLALGTYFNGSAADWRRSVIVLATMGAFLSAWSIALWKKRRSAA